MKNSHTVLFVDDDRNILNALKRLLRKEKYELLTAISGEEALGILKSRKVQLVISDQRMPGMKGNDLLATLRERYPDIIRVTLTGYTEVNAITESINRGHIYKFILKPWNDQNLKLEIRNALDYYDLAQDNRNLKSHLLQKCRELKQGKSPGGGEDGNREKPLRACDSFEEVSHALLEDLPVPVLGISKEREVVLINREAKWFLGADGYCSMKLPVQDFLPAKIACLIDSVLSKVDAEAMVCSGCIGRRCRVHAVALKCRFGDMAAILSILPTGKGPCQAESLSLPSPGSKKCLNGSLASTCKMFFSHEFDSPLDTPRHESINGPRKGKDIHG